jgi:hypothetical protein
VLPSAETVSFVLSGLSEKKNMAEKKGTRTNERETKKKLEIKKTQELGTMALERGSRNMTCSPLLFYPSR